MPRRIIDAHNHPNWRGLDADGIVRNMDEHGIAQAWLLCGDTLPPADAEQLPKEATPAIPPEATRLWGMLDCVRRHPDRFVAGWAPDPRHPHARLMLARAVRQHGVRVYGELKLRMRYDNADALAMFHACAGLGLPVVFHIEITNHIVAAECADAGSWPAWYGGDMAVVDAICRACPQTQFIGHAQGFWREISGDAAEDPDLYPEGPVLPGGRLLDVMRRHPNLHCDISANSAMTALSRDLDVAKGFFAEFQDRILFGRDAFERLQLDLLEKLDLSDEVLDKVCHRNAERLIAPTAAGGVAQPPSAV